VDAGQVAACLVRAGSKDRIRFGSRGCATFGVQDQALDWTHSCEGGYDFRMSTCTDKDTRGAVAAGQRGG
jgi:hypothetical protein